MQARQIGIGVGLTLLTLPLLAADRARERQPRPGAGGGGRTPSSFSPASRQSKAPSAVARTPQSGAERRHPRPGTGTGYRPSHGYYNYYPYYYPYYWSAGFYWGAPYYPYGYGYGYGYGGYPYYYRDYNAGSGAIRLLVEPAKARVLVDGYYAGIVDDFDGAFQRLYVAPGRHQLTLKLDGYRTHHARVYVGAGATMKLHYDMVKGTGEDTFEDLTEGAPPDDSDRGQTPYRTDEPSGRLRFEVRPEDASIYVDGRFWGTARDRGELKLPPGRHRVEVVRPGFRTEERDVEITAGRSERLEIELLRP